MQIREAIQKTVEGMNLSRDESYSVCNSLMSGEATDAQIAALLIAMRLKGETVDEITGFAASMREKVNPVSCQAKDLVDTCGTGGDRSGTFNISTVSALVASGAGCAVAKHGNRSVSSQSGSADLFKELDVSLELTPDQMAACIDQTGIGFLFAPKLHPAMKYAIGPRREMGVRTLFNILGPLTNPAGAKRQVMGVFTPSLLEPLTHVLKNLGSEHVLLVHGDGLDEISITGETQICELKDGEISTKTIRPEDFDIEPDSLDSIRGGTPAENAQMTCELLSGKKDKKRDVVLLNAGAVIYVSGLAESIAEGVEMAAESIDSGKALATLDKLQALSQSFNVNQ